MNGETWLVLGGSSSVGRAFARAAADAGSDILLAGRDIEDLRLSTADIRVRSGVAAKAMEFDATAYDTHDALVAACVKTARGTLNVFVAFGLMPEQADIDADFDKARRTIETNFLGAVSILSRLAPVLERQKGGKVVVLGSVAGDRGRVKNYVYGSSKAGLHAYVQGLRARLSRSGVRVVTVKPGVLDTAMTWGRDGAVLAAEPARVARACLRLAAKGPEIAYLPWFWRGIMAVICAIPEPLFKRLKI